MAVPLPSDGRSPGCLSPINPVIDGFRVTQQSFLPESDSFQAAHLSSVRVMDGLWTAHQSFSPETVSLLATCLNSSPVMDSLCTVHQNFSPAMDGLLVTCQSCSWLLSLSLGPVLEGSLAVPLNFLYCPHVDFFKCFYFSRFVPVSFCFSMCFFCALHPRGPPLPTQVFG